MNAPTRIRNPGRRAMRTRLESSHTRWDPKKGYAPGMINPIGGQMMRIDRTMPERQQIVSRLVAGLGVADLVPDPGARK